MLKTKLRTAIARLTDLVNPLIRRLPDRAAGAAFWLAAAGKPPSGTKLSGAARRELAALR